MLWTILLSLLFFALCTPSAQAKDLAWKDCVAGVNGGRDWERQIAGCTKILERGAKESAKKLPTAFTYRGMGYYEKSDFGQPIADSDEGSLDPKNSATLNERGMAYLKKGALDRTIAHLEEAIRLDPRNGTNLLRRCRAFDKMRIFDRAFSDCNEVIRLDPKDPIGYNNRGHAYRVVGDFDRAIADLDQAIGLDPKFANPHNHRGLAWLGKGDAERALADINEALSQYPKYANGLASRGLVNEKKGDSRRALEDFEAALTIEPGRREPSEGRLRLKATLTVDGRTAPAQPAASSATASSAPAQEAAVAPATPAISGPSPSSMSPPMSYSCSGSKRVASVVGNSNYPGVARLANPPNDAEDIAALLRDKLCFKVIPPTDATRAVFSQRIGEFAEAAQGGEMALFYYAGHGMQFQQANYPLPVDLCLANEYEATHNNVSAQGVVAMLESRAKFTLVFLDACRDNPIEEEFRRCMNVVKRGFGETRGPAQMTSRGGETLVVFATPSNERAADGDGRNSPFTHTFL